MRAGAGTAAEGDGALGEVRVLRDPLVGLAGACSVASSAHQRQRRGVVGCGCTMEVDVDEDKLFHAVTCNCI